ncbi:MAG TPA: DUF6599 family protein [Terriglobales bacterium]|nr:DUF6599 family protein [Terriglobales bacterium]
MSSRLPKWFFGVALCAALLVSVRLAQAAPNRAPARSFLPNEFSGWQLTGAPRLSTDPAEADPAFSSLLGEYGFTDFESAKYIRDDHSIRVKAARFNDATGAYGAFTFYRQPEMLNETIGDKAASANLRVLFCRGNILVDAVLDHMTAMSAAELRELAGSLPIPVGGARNLPVLVNYLPRQSLLQNSAKYIVGPIGFNAISAPISANLVDFSKGAEVVLGKYSTSDGVATLMIISYPTPQIAAERLRAIEASSPGTSHESQPRIKRSGPIVVLTTGQISAGDARSLLASVNYDANVTWNENTFLSKRDNVGNLIIGIFILIAMLVGFSLVAGIFFGGFRLLMKRLFPDRIFDRSKDVEIISLRLGK